MLITTLPDPKMFEDNGSAVTKNAVLFASTNQKYQYPSHTTPYMVAVNFINKGHYAINKQPVTISEKCFYFLNPGDQLGINFAGTLPLQTMFLFFNEAFADESLHSITKSTDYLLSDPEAQTIKKFSIPNIPFRTSELAAHFISLLNHRLSTDELDERLFNFLSSFVKINSELSKELKKIGSVKKATREELYKRLFVARDFMEDNFTSAININQIAAVSCMNKFHFLAKFKELYGITPHQYLIELKLNKAHQLLKTRQNTVSEVCYSVGFDSVPSFSLLFKKRFNVSPSSSLLMQ